MKHLHKFNENTLTTYLDNGVINDILNIARDEGLYVVVDQERDPEFVLIKVHNYSDDPWNLEFEDRVLDSSVFYELCQNINIRLNMLVGFDMIFCAWDKNNQYREYSEIKNLDDYQLVEVIFTSQDGQDVYL